MDDSPLNRLDKRIESGKQRLAAFAGYATTAFAAGAYGAYRMVDAASHADEALNVLTRTFGSQTNQVLEWSRVLGDEVGRSMFDLQDSAGKFGAFLEPQFKGRTEEITAMSQELTKLSVDLASFYNTSDQEASMRLFSGLSGETEAVRRLGIDISDTSLDDFNKKHGDDKTRNKRMAALSLQEKTLLRYRKILADTVGKQNDAALTANSWANQLKKLQAEMHVLAVTLGRELIPFAKQLLKAGHGLVELFKTLTVRTDGLRDAFIALAYVGVASTLWSIGAALKSAGLIGGFVQLTAAVTGAASAAVGLMAIAAALAVIEDSAGFLQGKKSILGDLITEVTGVQRPLQAVRETAEDIAAYFRQAAAAALSIASIPIVGFAGAKAMFDAMKGEDPDDLARRRTVNHENAFQQAAEGYSAFDPSNARQGESDLAAGQRFLDARAADRRLHPEKTTADEVAQGLGYVSGISAPPPLAPNAYGPTRAANPIVQGVTIYVNGTSDPALVAKKVAEQLESLRTQDTRRNSLNAALRGAQNQTSGAGQ